MHISRLLVAVLMDAPKGLVVPGWGVGVYAKLPVVIACSTVAVASATMGAAVTAGIMPAARLSGG